MKAIVYQGVRDVGVREVADPRIENEDDIIVKVTSTAICGSDLHLIHGRVKGMYDGYVLGHETMGIVEETGRGVAAVKKGDRVVVPFPVACGHCAFCEAGEYSQTARPEAFSATANPTVTMRAGRRNTFGSPMPTWGRLRFRRSSPTNRRSSVPISCPHPAGALTSAASGRGTRWWSRGRFHVRYVQETDSRIHWNIHR